MISTLDLNTTQLQSSDVVFARRFNNKIPNRKIVFP